MEQTEQRLIIQILAEEIDKNKKKVADIMKKENYIVGKENEDVVNCLCAENCFILKIIREVCEL